MSLHALANHLQSAGRGSDKVLVHMTPGEVKGLQSLAMAHGGSLTVNPETGLPEAGFLSSILPMIAGFALNAFLPGVGTAIGSALGTSSAVGTGILVGGATGIAKGSLKEGIMAGLGAYGGAGMAEGLSAVGAANAPSVKIDPIVDGMDDIYGSYGPGSYTGNFSGTQIQNATSGLPTATVNPTGGFNSLNLSQTPTGQFADITGSNVAHMYAPQTPVDVSGIASQVKPVPVAEMSYAPGMGPAPANMSLAPPPAAPYTAVKPPMVDASNFNPNAYNVSPTNTSMGMKVPTPTDNITGGLRHIKDTGFQGVKDVWNATPTGTGLGLAATGMSVMQSQQEEEAAAARAAADAAAAERSGYIRPYEFSTSLTENAFAPRASTSENRYFVEPRFTAKDVYKVKEGGLTSLAVGGPVEQMAAQNAMGSNTMYPQSQLQTAMYANPMVQRPVPNDVITSGIDAPTDRYTGEMRMAAGGVARFGGGGAMQFANPEAEARHKYAAEHGPGIIKTIPDDEWNAYKKLNDLSFKSAASAAPTYTYNPASMQYTDQAGNVTGGITGYQGYAVGGGISDLGGYSDGGRLLRGPGDGVSDSIPASIGNRQPARLADGEFVIPARIVSEIGNGSTEAGARKLYAMMDRVQHARKKTVGKDQVAKNTKAERLLPA